MGIFIVTEFEHRQNHLGPIQVDYYDFRGTYVFNMSPNVSRLQKEHHAMRIHDMMI